MGPCSTHHQRIIYWDRNVEFHDFCIDPLGYISRWNTHIFLKFALLLGKLGWNFGESTLVVMNRKNTCIFVFWGNGKIELGEMWGIGLARFLSGVLCIIPDRPRRQYIWARGLPARGIFFLGAMGLGPGQFGRFRLPPLKQEVCMFLKHTKRTIFL